MSLRKQTLSGLFWTFIDTFFVSGISFFALIYIARLLGPEEFGLVGMVTIFIAIGTSLVDSGLSSSIIRTKNADDRDFTTVFYLNLMVSIVVYMLLFFLAPFIAEFFRQHVLTLIIRVYSLIFMISALSAVHLARLIRDMRFKSIMQYNLPGTLLSIIVGIVLSIRGYGVWSIVWMSLTKQFMQTVLLWLFLGWKPSMNFSKEKMKYHYGFGYKLMLSGLLNTIFEHSYNIVIGRYFTVQTLGFFERASALNNYPVTTLTGIINKVTYPMFSKIQDEREKVADVYKQLLQASFFLSAPLMLGAAAIARPLFELFLGNQWLGAVPYFQILCLASIFMPVHAFNLNILKVFGRSDLFLRLEICKKAIIVVGLIVGFRFGILGLIWSSVITSFIALLINTHYSQNLISYHTRRQLADMVPTFLIAFVTATTMAAVVWLLREQSLTLQILIPSVIGFIIYFAINGVLKTQSVSFLLNTLNRNIL